MTFPLLAKTALIITLGCLATGASAEGTVIELLPHGEWMQDEDAASSELDLSRFVAPDAAPELPFYDLSNLLDRGTGAPSEDTDQGLASSDEDTRDCAGQIGCR